MTVLVLGGSGFIGSNLLKIHEDWDNIDLKNGDDILDGLDTEYDTVVLLAAHLGQGVEDYLQNLAIYSEVANYIDTYQPHIIYTSSAAVYDDNYHVKHHEDELTIPHTLYGKSKLLGEKIITDVSQTYTILRLSNVFGDGGHGVINIFQNGGKTIYGDGEQVRDYVHVSKVVRVIEQLVSNPTIGTCNISSGTGITVNRAFEKYGSGEAEHVKPRTFDVEHSVLDNSLAHSWGLR